MSTTIPLAPRLHARFVRPDPLSVARVVAVLGLLTTAMLTPGFISLSSFNALLTTASFIGCVAAAMTMVTLGGNVLTLALGATAAVCAVVFMNVANGYGFGVGVAAAILTGAAMTAAQGWLIGSIRANPVIVTIAASVLIYGTATWLTGNATVNSVHPRPAFLNISMLGVPNEFLVFVGVIVLGQLVLSYTRFGRKIFLVGSGWRAAEALGIDVSRTTVIAYAIAGGFTATAGILLALRYGQANMELARGYDYDAIAAVLVGGTAIQGGDGSMVRTFAGVLTVSVIQVLLLLHGVRQEWRFFLTGLLVLTVVVVYAKRKGR